MVVVVVLLLLLIVLLVVVLVLMLPVGAAPAEPLSRAVFQIAMGWEPLVTLGLKAAPPRRRRTKRVPDLVTKADLVASGRWQESTDEQRQQYSKAAALSRQKGSLNGSSSAARKGAQHEQGSYKTD